MRIAQEVFDLMETGMSHGASCRRVGVPKRTCLDWRDDAEIGEWFVAQYARARERMIDAVAEDILEIADDGSNDYMERFDKDGESLGYFLNGEHVQRSRLRVDSRKWLLSKLRPGQYGDKLDLNHGTQDGDPIQDFIKAVTGQALKPKDKS